MGGRYLVGSMSFRNCFRISDMEPCMTSKILPLLQIRKVTRKACGTITGNTTEPYLGSPFCRKVGVFSIFNYHMNYCAGTRKS